MFPNFAMFNCRQWRCYFHFLHKCHINLSQIFSCSHTQAVILKQKLPASWIKSHSLPTRWFNSISISVIVCSVYKQCDKNKNSNLSTQIQQHKKYKKSIFYLKFKFLLPPFPCSSCWCQSEQDVLPNMDLPPLCPHHMNAHL